MIRAVLLAALLAGGVAEPGGYWTGPMLGDTPATLHGATVIDVDALDRLIAAGAAVMIDVSPAPPRPAGLASGSYWSPLHRSVPGSHWLPGAGAGDLDPARATTLAALAAGWTGGDLRRPVVVFCHSHCWASWNAARRLVTLGYRDVRWFPGGIEAWQERHGTVVVGEGWILSAHPIGSSGDDRATSHQGHATDR